MGFFDKTRQIAATKQAEIDALKPKTDLASLSSLPALSVPLNLALGVAPMPHQEVPVQAVREGHRALLIGDEMGVGKTLTAIAIVEDQQAFPSLLVVPPALVRNWQREWERACPHRTIGIVSGKTPGVVPDTDIVIAGDAVVWPWTMEPKPDTKDKFIPTGPLGKHSFRSIVVDEGHRMKEETSQRTRAVLAISRGLPRDAVRLVMSGTPLTNRPRELAAPLEILGHLRPLFGGSFPFKNRYCGPVYNGFGMTYDGSSNESELNLILRNKVMIRRMRSEVLDLPNKGRSIVQVELSPKAQREYDHALRDLQDYLRGVRDDEDYSLSWRAEAIVLLNTLRKVSGTGKIDAIVEATLDLLDEGEQVFIAVIHHDVVDALWSAISAKGKRVVTVTGRDSTDDKQAAVDKFQAGKADVLIGNIQAAGVGFTMTAARHIIVGELPWTPGELQQVEDRLNRIGQTREVICSIYVSDVEGGSVDQRLWGLLNEKAKVIGSVLDGNDSGLAVDGESIANQLMDSFR